MIELPEYVRKQPDAVFIRRTDAVSPDDEKAFRRAGYAIARALLVQQTPDVDQRTFVVKPNVVAASNDGKRRNPEPNGGMVTNPDFVGGIVQRLQELGAGRVLVAEGGGSNDMRPVFDDRGYTRMAEELGIELVDLCRPPGTYDDSELNWTPVDGVVFKEIPFVRPINDPDTVLINVPTMKTHNLGVISLCAKNLQGTVVMGYRHFCNPIQRALEHPGAADRYQPGLVETIRTEYERHLREGYPRWDQEGTLYEGYAQRTCDAVMGINDFLHIVEGVIGRDGTAFHKGKDVLTNLTVAGVNPVHVDAVTAYLMGHDPRNIGYLKVAQERGLGTHDPERIPLFLLDDDEGPVPCRLEELDRVELGVYFRGDDSQYIFF